MGTKGNEIIGMDVSKLVTELNKALADEWLAYYQYWLGAKVVKGQMREAVTAELIEHADDELRHAGMLADRITQLGGTPVLTPEEWYKVTNCGYDAPSDPHVRKIVEQNIAGERCAIEVYQKLSTMLKDKDPITYNMALEILADEVEHEDDLEAILEDMDLVKKG
ncbi:ferritin [candidate division WOR-3 bacterium]|uniref:Ferritin n=1 Tax=candidate division WOR-3 bacterium TaxID=2052148 RepID=A0A9D5K9U3_UNCW3|nr:ferritin [candidate division WOR-3 bacterium]MBD3364922.1 ferritin [candidate division WOR-3 bacterium]